MQTKIQTTGVRERPVGSGVQSDVLEYAVHCELCCIRFGINVIFSAVSSVNK